jgi:hypothetical protein
MMKDDRDFVERSKSIAEKFTGRPASIDDIADEFAIHGIRKRVAALEDLDAELREEIDSSVHNLRRRAQLIELRRKMGSVHAALRKADR